MTTTTSAWRLTTLADSTLRIGSGITPSGGSKVYLDSGRPFVRSQNVGWGDLRLDDLAHIDEATHANFLRSEIRSGDVLINITGASIGRCAMATHALDGGNVNQHVCQVRVNANQLNPYFVQEFVLSDLGQRQIRSFQAGGNREGLNFKQIGSIVLPLPSLEEQSRISQALRDSTKLLVSMERLIAKKQAIKQGMMQELLSGKTRLPGFDAPWGEIKIKDIVSSPVTDGPHLTPVFQNEGVPFLSVNNIVDGKIDWSDIRYISPKDDQIFSQKCKPRRGDVLLGKAASVGKVAFIDTDIDLNIWSPIALIRPSERFVPEFVYFQLQSGEAAKQIGLLTNTSSQGNIGMGDIERISLRFPEKSEQVAIVEILNDVNSDISLLQKRLEQCRRVKQGMMQELLTGRTRLTPTGE